MARQGDDVTLTSPCESRRRFLAASGLAWAGLSSSRSMCIAQAPVAGVPKVRFSPQPAPCRNMPYGGEPRSVPPKGGALVGKLWELGTSPLIVHLLNGSDCCFRKSREMIERIAPIWCDYAHLTFKFVDVGPSHIRVNVLPFEDSLKNVCSYGYYDSMIGQDAQSIPTQQTMNLIFDPALEKRDPKLAADEYRRHILHEFGHAIGFLHEHQRENAEIDWNDAKLYEHAKQTWQWDKKTVDEQIKYVETGKQVGTVFDPKSIMVYWFPPELGKFKDGSEFNSKVNVDLSPLDKVAAAVMYPTTRATTPRKRGGNLAVNVPAETETIDENGQVAAFQLDSGPMGGVMTIEINGMAVLAALVNKESAVRDPTANILAAAETPANNTACVFKTPSLKKNTSYFIEVRGRKPVQGVGKFSIRVHL